MPPRPDVSVITTAHDVADARLHRVVAAMSDAGLSVEVIGLGDATAGPPGAQLRTFARRGLLVRALRAVVLPWRARGRVLVILDPDLVPSAALRRRTGGRALVVDVHEDYLALLSDRSWSRGVLGMVTRAMVRTATALGRRADLTVLADEHLPPGAARNRLVVRNLPDPAMLPARGPLDPQPRALYVGDIRASRGLFVMLDAIRAAPPWSLDLVGPVARADEPRLEAELRADPGLAARVRLHGRMEPRASWSLARGAWAGLLMLEATEAFDLAVPTKLYEYLACGLPVIATPLTRQAQIVNESGGGVVVSGAEDASVLLRRWAGAATEVTDVGNRGRSWWESGAAGASGYAELAASVATLSGRT